MSEKILIPAWASRRLVKFLDAHIRKHKDQYKSRSDFVLQSILNQLSSDIHRDYVASNVCEVELGLKMLADKNHSLLEVKQ